MAYAWQYIRYFFYLAWNWNLRLAIFLIWHEIRGEKKYQVHTVGIDDLKTSIPHPEWLHASIYQPVNFYIAEKLFAELTPTDKQTGFLDAGCGKGRVLAMAAANGFQEITGFDLSAEMTAVAHGIAKDLEKRFPDASINILTANAKHFEVPSDVGVIFLFNPFDNMVMIPFVKRVMKSLAENPRELTVLYANPVCKERWLEHGFTETFHLQKMQYLEGSVLKYDPKKMGQ